MADLPAAILPYAEVALSGPLETGVIAHRPGRVTIDVTEPDQRADVGVDGRPLKVRRVFVAACDLAELGKQAPERITCSAGWAHTYGAQACTADRCYPGTPGDHLPAGG